MTARVSVVACTLLLGGRALAGPPYLTDDPVPTRHGHWEIYGFVTAAHAPGDTAGEAGFDVNYGGAEDLQLTLVVPLAFERAEARHAGAGVVETAAKWRVVHQDEDGWRPDVALFPRIFWPAADRRFGSQRASLLLPVWLGKDIGSTSVFGGGGYDINPGDGNRNFWITGIAVTQAVREGIAVGGELFRHSADAPGGSTSTALSAGFNAALSEHWSVLASTQGRAGSYLALLASF